MFRTKPSDISRVLFEIQHLFAVHRVTEAVKAQVIPPFRQGCCKLSMLIRKSSVAYLRFARTHLATHVTKYFIFPGKEMNR